MLPNLPYLLFIQSTSRRLLLTNDRMITKMLIERFESIVDAFRPSSEAHNCLLKLIEYLILCLATKVSHEFEALAWYLSIVGEL